MLFEQTSGKTVKHMDVILPNAFTGSFNDMVQLFQQKNAEWTQWLKKVTQTDCVCFITRDKGRSWLQMLGASEHNVAW